MRTTPIPEASPGPGTPDRTIRDPRRRRDVLIAVCVALMAVIA